MLPTDLARLRALSYTRTFLDNYKTPYYKLGSLCQNTTFFFSQNSRREWGTRLISKKHNRTNREFYILASCIRIYFVRCLQSERVDCTTSMWLGRWLRIFYSRVMLEIVQWFLVYFTNFEVMGAYRTVAKCLFESKLTSCVLSTCTSK